MRLCFSCKFLCAVRVDPTIKCRLFHSSCYTAVDLPKHSHCVCAHTLCIGTCNTIPIWACKECDTYDDNKWNQYNSIEIRVWSTFVIATQLLLLLSLRFLFCCRISSYCIANFPHDNSQDNDIGFGGLCNPQLRWHYTACNTRLVCGRLFRFQFRTKSRISKMSQDWYRITQIVHR